MNWYISKVVYRIVCGNGNHTPQFDEQLRLIEAEDDLHAFQKARLLGEKEEDSFQNDKGKPVIWKFIDVQELFLLSELSDGTELYSQIKEEDSCENYIKGIHKRANTLLGKCLEKNTFIN
ncbi:MAG: DUF4288 domain-containing protein [Chitinophagaceae bacterium]|nr:DUF4288 domain-containing protein [Chitinophagaceae bacterium]